MIRGKLSSLLRMGAVRRGLLAEALLWLALARLALWILPFRLVSMRLGNPVPLEDVDRHATLLGGGKDDARLAQDIGWTRPMPR